MFEKEEVTPGEKISAEQTVISVGNVTPVEENVKVDAEEEAVLATLKAKAESLKSKAQHDWP